MLPLDLRASPARYGRELLEFIDEPAVVADWSHLMTPRLLAEERSTSRRRSGAGTPSSSSFVYRSEVTSTSPASD